VGEHRQEVQQAGQWAVRSVGVWGLTISILSISGGGGVNLVNCTMYGNEADSDVAGGGTGGGVYCYQADPNVINCIMWDDVAGASNSEIAGDGFPNVYYCDIEQASGTYPGVGNINADPDFDDGGDGTEPAGDDGEFGTMDDELRLSLNDTTTSPCIDKADGDLATLKDVLQRYRVDIDGVGNGIGEPDYTDMGSYEAYRYDDISGKKVVAVCIIDESSPYHNERTGLSTFTTDETAYNDMLTDYSGDVIESICLVPPTEVQEQGYNKNITDVLAPPNYYKPNSIEVEQCKRPPLKDELISFFKVVQNAMAPDYVVISLDGSGSGDGDYVMVEVYKFEEWLEVSFPGVMVHDRKFPNDAGSGPAEEWIEELEYHISDALEGSCD